MPRKKYYTVWKGLSPGVYNSWAECFLQTKGCKGALYKAFDTREEAEKAFSASAYAYIGKDVSEASNVSEGKLPENFDKNCLVVDAACSGNPGKMEYRGIYLLTGKEIFHFGPVYGTNNIGEFLAIVHGLALLKQKGIQMPVYSDSRNALMWVRQKKCRTKLERTEKTEDLFQMITRAEKWLADNPDISPIYKWETEKWGEIPADFGRK